MKTVQLVVRTICTELRHGLILSGLELLRLKFQEEMNIVVAPRKPGGWSARGQPQDQAYRVHVRMFLNGLAILHVSMFCDSMGIWIGRTAGAGTRFLQGYERLFDKGSAGIQFQPLPKDTVLHVGIGHERTRSEANPNGRLPLGSL